MKRKLISALLCLCMVLTLLPMAAMAADFTDTEGNWAESSIDRWAGLGVVNGVGDGKFDPEAGMTRAEFAKTLTELMKLSGEADLSEFTDVDPDAWYVPALEAANAAGILNGDGTKMDPDGELTREMMFVMIGRALGVEPSETCEKTIPDIDKAEDYAVGYINALVNMGVLNGTDDLGSVEPAASIERCATMAVLDRLIGGYATEDGATVEIEKGKITLIVADNVKVKGEADPERPIVVTGAAKTVDLKEVEGTPTVQVNVSDVAVKNAPAGTVVKQQPDAELENITVDGTDVTKQEDGEYTVPEKKPTTPSYTPSTDPEPEEKHTYTVTFDATWGEFTQPTVNEENPDTCYGGDQWQFGVGATSTKITWAQVTVTGTASDLAKGLANFNAMAPHPVDNVHHYVFVGWFKDELNVTGETPTDEFTETTGITGNVTVHALWKIEDGKDATCYGGANNDVGNWKGTSEAYPAAPTEETYRIIFDATTYGVIKLKQNGTGDDTCNGGENTCWGGENTCWGGENADEAQGGKWAYVDVTATAPFTLEKIGPDPTNVFEVTGTGDYSSYTFDGWYYKDSTGYHKVEYSTTIVSNLVNEYGNIVLTAGWKTATDGGSTCNGGENSDNGSYGSTTSDLPTTP